MKRFLLIFILMLGACANPPNEPVDDSASIPPATSTVSDAVTETVAPTPEQPEEEPMSVEELANTIVDLNTSKGTISIRFFPETAPNHVQNFVSLAKSGFYDGTKFHRIKPGFMVQGGDPNTKTANRSTWGTGGSEQRLKAEFSKTPHRRGIVSMARFPHPDSASSQFFIVVADSTFLDNQYTVFGEVTSGMEVADQIVSASRNAQDQPDEPVEIQSVAVRSAE